jgi:dTMP kinase
MNGSGFFIVLEGPDGAGKSTLAQALAERIRAAGHEPVRVREPGGTPVAEALRAELLGRETRDWTPELELLYMTTARADVVAHVIRPALEAGQVVLSDRYDLSTMAYQVAGRGVDASLAAQCNRAATGGLRPDMTLVIDVDPGLGQRRQEASGKARDRLDRETPEFHARVAARYLAEAGPGVHHLRGEEPAQQLADAAWAALRGARPDLFGNRQ